VINVCFCILSAVLQLRALLYVLCAFVTLNKDYLLTYLQPHQHPTTLFFTGQMPFLPPNQQRQSTVGKFRIPPTLLTTGNRYRPLKKIAVSNLLMQTNGNFNAS